MFAFNNCKYDLNMFSFNNFIINAQLILIVSLIGLRITLYLLPTNVIECTADVFDTFPLDLFLLQLIMVLVLKNRF